MRPNLHLQQKYSYTNQSFLLQLKHSNSALDNAFAAPTSLEAVGNCLDDKLVGNSAAVPSVEVVEIPSRRRVAVDIRIQKPERRIHSLVV